MLRFIIQLTNEAGKNSICNFVQMTSHGNVNTVRLCQKRNNNLVFIMKKSVLKLPKSRTR
jgi:hypothetical protein